MKKPIIVLFLSFFGLSTSAQEAVPTYSDYLMDNYYLLHPSMAGASNCAKIRLTARNQWITNNDSPALQTLTFNTSLGERSGVGATLFNDRNGYHSQMGAKLTYAHHISFSRSDYDLNKLSFGLSAGMAQTSIDQENWLIYNEDPLIQTGVVVKDQYFMVDVGASYHYLEFFTHFTVKNAFTTKLDIYSDIENNNQRSYVLGAGYVFGKYKGMNRHLDNGFTWEPSVLLHYFERTKQKNIDVNLKAYKEFSSGELYGGVSYRTSLGAAEYRDGKEIKKQYYHSVSPFFGVKYKNLSLGYTYSHQFGEVYFEKMGFHQLTLGFNFNCKSSDYKCSCPSINF